MQSDQRSHGNHHLGCGPLFGPARVVPGRWKVPSSEYSNREEPAEGESRRAHFPLSEGRARTLLGAMTGGPATDGGATL